ncbi:hypothetical protein HZB03_03895 [Candidatus Woesearchaeota archaeon]|nr:hypothetical protein [Candidatus Woesearchaeota archaeon]
MIKHDKYVEELCSTIESRYDLLQTHVPLFSKRHRCVAEIDILAMKGDFYDIYEVKCSHRIAKAKKQLRKIKKLLSTTSRIRQVFFFCGESKTLIQVKA